MDQHPVPRQITTFEFKLIGFFTVKQFIYIIVFLPVGYIVYALFPIPILNIILGLLVGGIGFAFALLPINERPLDIWVRNLFKRLTSPTQYTFHKNNPPIYFFSNLYFVSDPHQVSTHIESQEKLAAYLQQTNQTQQANVHKQQVHNLLKKSPPAPVPVSVVPPPVIPMVPEAEIKKEHATPLPAALTQQPEPVITSIVTTVAPPPEAPVTPPVKSTAPAVTSPKKPFLTGTIKNHRLLPLPGMLIYVKDATGGTVRLLKTNPHGIFATFNPLPAGDYSFEPKDPRNTYFFDTMNIHIDGEQHKPFEFFSKELL